MSSLDELMCQPLLDHRFPLPTDRPFSATQASGAGLGEKALRQLHTAGLIRRLCRGVYVASQVDDSLLVRAQALALVVPSQVAVVDWTACWLWTGLLPPNDHLQVPPVSFFRFAGRGRLRNGLCRSGERAFVAADLTEVAGLTLTTPLRTALDLGRLERRDQAMVALDGLVRHTALSREAIVGDVERFRRQRGVVQLRALAPLADARSESPGESVLRLRWLDEGRALPPPTPQVVIADAWGREVARLDLGVPEIRYAAEYDGVEWHSSTDQREHDLSRRSWLSHEHGWTVDVFVKENLYGPTRDVEARLGLGVRRARARLGR